MDQLLEEREEGGAVEDRRELVGEPGPSLDCDGAKDVAGLSLAEGVDAGLLPDRRPRPVEAAVQPEARFVLEGYDATAGSGFFFIRGNVSRSQMA